LKCGAREGWRGTAGPIVSEMEKSDVESKKESSVLHTIKRRKANWIGHILRRNWILKHVIKGKIGGRRDVTGRRGRRRKQLLDDLKEARKYWKLKEDALYRTLWRTRFVRGCAALVRLQDE
jgi:hypothetical protein